VLPNGDNFALHLIPSGILTPGVNNVIGNGVVVDPGVLLDELSGLDERGVDTSSLLISADAHLLMPYHVAIDKVTERFLGKKKIGTTGRGIGPCYQDKIARVGVRAADVLDESILTQKVEAALELKNQILVKIYNRRAMDPAQVVDDVLAQAEHFKHRIADTQSALAHALEDGQNVLLEGSQGTLLDVDHGTYPYVTSSNPTAGGAAVRAGGWRVAGGRRAPRPGGGGPAARAAAPPGPRGRRDPAEGARRGAAPPGAGGPRARGRDPAADPAALRPAPGPPAAVGP